MEKNVENFFNEMCLILQLESKMLNQNIILKLKYTTNSFLRHSCCYTSVFNTRLIQIRQIGTLKTEQQRQDRLLMERKLQNKNKVSRQLSHGTRFL